MISRLDELLNFHRTALNVRSQRQQVLASNIANADVPQFKARDIDFGQALESALAQGASSPGNLSTTSPRHLSAAPESVHSANLLYRVPRQDSIDGNTVEMDVERAQFAENALHVEANLTFLNSQIKMMLAAIQG
ncbi:MAG TPA: flagellar basal body rod protein FlgB [Burkholderiales bacterium]|nr:flagellar basal body rod protein FlgB [Burkholderiales bacterium]